MRALPKKVLLPFIIVLLINKPIFPQKVVKQWDVVEFKFKSTNTVNNPYVSFIKEGENPHLLVEFNNETASPRWRKILVAGFWDGGETWLVRFAPPCIGKWTYRTISSDSAMNNIHGEFICKPWNEKDKQENPIRHGFIYVNNIGYRKGRYFVYEDGTPFLWIGDTWWEWTKRCVRFENFKKLVDDRASKGFTVGQMYIGFGQAVDPTVQHLNFEQIHKIESLIRYANSRGIVIAVHGLWMWKRVGKIIGEDKIIRWWKYLVHRLGAYNVVWVLSSEYNNYDYGGLSREFFYKLGELVKREDPYKRIISLHNTPPGWEGGEGAPQWSTAKYFHSQKWLDYNQSQVGHGKWRNEMIPIVVSAAYGKKPPKPIVITEPWYEFLNGSASAPDVRFGAWSAFLSGAAGYTYGGGHVWRAYLPECHEKNLGKWPVDTTITLQESFNYPGAQSIGWLAHFLKNKEWWKFEPHPELISDNPSKFCAAILGREYLILLRWGGAVRVDFSETKGNIMNYEWINLATGKSEATGEIRTKGIYSFLPPEDYPEQLNSKDMLLHIWLKRQ